MRRKLRPNRLVLQLCWVSLAQSANATSFVLNVVAAPSAGTIQTDVDALNEVGQVWTATAIDRIAGDVAEDLTSTSFGFDGFSMKATFTSLTGGPVTLDGIQLLAAATAVSAVPEPSVGVLVGAGLVGVGLRRRR